MLTGSVADGPVPRETFPEEVSAPLPAVSRPVTCFTWNNPPLNNSVHSGRRTRQPGSTGSSAPSANSHSRADLQRHRSTSSQTVQRSERREGRGLRLVVHPHQEICWGWIAVARRHCAPLQALLKPSPMPGRPCYPGISVLRPPERHPPGPSACSQSPRGHPGSATCPRRSCRIALLFQPPIAKAPLLSPGTQSKQGSRSNQRQAGAARYVHSSESLAKSPEPGFPRPPNRTLNRRPNGKHRERSHGRRL